MNVEHVEPKIYIIWSLWKGGNSYEYREMKVTYIIFYIGKKR